jgi:uncharacterized protein (TIGR02996 family)
MASEDSQFLSAILAKPHDQELRLVYADWLQERGDPRGDYLRVRCQLDALPVEQRIHSPLHAREQELRQLCPANWLAALAGPQWCLVGNVVKERQCDPGGTETRHGTKHFSGGTKVYCCWPSWDHGGEQCVAIGRHRGSKRYTVLVMFTRYVTNFRAELVYEPAVLRRMASSGLWRSHGKEEVERWVEYLGQKANQPPG